MCVCGFDGAVLALSLSDSPGLVSLKLFYFHEPLNIPPSEKKKKKKRKKKKRDSQVEGRSELEGCRITLSHGTIEHAGGKLNQKVPECRRLFVLLA